MFDQLNGTSTAQNAVTPGETVSRGGETTMTPHGASSKCASNAVLVWLRWRGESSALIGAARLSAEPERFRLVDAQRSAEDAELWRCRFEESEAAPFLERRAQALLRRLSAIGKWVRAERVFQRAASADEASDAYRWEAFSRRPLR